MQSAKMLDFESPVVVVTLKAEAAEKPSYETNTRVKITKLRSLSHVHVVIV